MMSGLNDLIQSISLPELLESSILLPKKSSHVAEVSEKPMKQRALLKDVTNILSASEPDPSDGSVESCPTTLTFARFQYTRKNINKTRIEFICRHDRSKRKGLCKHVRLYLPIVKGLVKYDQLEVIGAHTKGCCEAVG